MKRPYNLVVFDWEGTLAEDVYGQVVNFFVKKAVSLQLSDFDKSFARKLAPYGLTSMVAQIFPNIGMRQQEKILEEVQEELTAAQTKVILMPGAQEAVQRIHAAGIMLGIATNRSLSSLQKVLSISGLGDYFQVIKTVSQAPAKPSPDMLEEIIFECNTVNSATLMVGDSISDIEMAVAVGTDSVAVDFYHVQPDTFLQMGASLEIDNYQDLLNYLKI